MQGFLWVFLNSSSLLLPMDQTNWVYSNSAASSNDNVWRLTDKMNIKQAVLVRLNLTKTHPVHSCINVTYFCHHLSDNYVDLLDLYVDFSVIHVDLSAKKKHHTSSFISCFYGVLLPLTAIIMMSTCQMFIFWHVRYFCCHLSF